MSWGSELWDKYEQICSHTEHQIEFIKRVCQFVKERIHAELNYAKEIRKLVKNFKRKDEEESKYFVVRTFAGLVAETNDYAGQRELIAEYLQNDVHKALQDLSKNTLLERKKLMNDGVELHRALKESMDLLEKMRRIYMKASEEKEAAAHALEKADNDPQSTKAKIDKLTQVSRAKDQAAEEARNNYILQLESTNQYRSDHYKQKMPTLMDAFMQLNTDHINRYKSIIATYAESHRKVHPVINTCLSNITTSSENVDPHKDNLQFISEHKTGYEVPGAISFDEYQGKYKKEKKEKKDDKKKFEARDFSHLPPEQRKKKLLKKIAELEAASNKAISDKTAMEKMKGIYAKNPQLGDVQQVSQQLIETQEKIDALAADMEEFQRYLSQAETHPSTTKKDTSTISAPSAKQSKSNQKKKDKDSSSNKDTNDIEIISNDQLPNACNTKDSVKDTSGTDGNETWFSDDESHTSKLKKAILLYDFEAQTEDELSCCADDTVIVLDDMGDGWVKVKNATNSEGYIPQSYVEYLS